jgi:hypothetical protein
VTDGEAFSLGAHFVGTVRDTNKAASINGAACENFRNLFGAFDRAQNSVVIA